MPELPELRDWKALIEKQLNTAAYVEKDILRIMYMCQDYLSEIQPIGQWLGQQEGYIRNIHRIFGEIYLTMFGQQPPPRPVEEPVKEMLLDTLESRKQAVRDVALSITNPGDDISDEAVLEELQRRGMKIDGFNPTAIISTILNGFKPQFEKIEGKRGVFRRRP